MDYSKMTQDDFDRVLSQIVKEDAAVLLTVPGVYKAVSEHYNNEVLERWENEERELYQVGNKIKTPEKPVYTRYGSTDDVDERYSDPRKIKSN